MESLLTLDVSHAVPNNQLSRKSAPSATIDDLTLVPTVVNSGMGSQCQAAITLELDCGWRICFQDDCPACWSSLVPHQLVAAGFWSSLWWRLRSLPRCPHAMASGLLQPLQFESTYVTAIQVTATVLCNLPRQ